MVIGLDLPGKATFAGVKRVLSEFCARELDLDAVGLTVVAARRATVSGKPMVLVCVPAQVGQAVMDRKGLLDGSCGVSIDRPRTREALQKRYALRQRKPRPQAEEVPFNAQPASPSPQPDAASLPPAVRREKRTTLPQEDQASGAQQRVCTSPGALRPAQQKCPPAPATAMEGAESAAEKEWAAECVLEERLEGGVRQYLIKFVGYDEPEWQKATLANKALKAAWQLAKAESRKELPTPSGVEEEAQLPPPPPPPPPRPAPPPPPPPARRTSARVAARAVPPA